MALGCQGGGCPLTQRLAHKGDHEPLAQGAPPKLSRSIVASSAQCRSSIATAVKAADRESSPRNGANSRSRGAPGGTTRSAHRQPAARYRTTGPAGAGSAAHRTHPTTSGLPCCAAETPPAARSCQSPIPRHQHQAAIASARLGRILSQRPQERRPLQQVHPQPPASWEDRHLSRRGGSTTPYRPLGT